MSQRIQYQPSAPGGKYRPQQTDERKIARMREEAARQVQGMQRVAEAEIRSREKVLASMKEDEAYTARAEERNYRTAAANSQRKLDGLQRQQVRDQQQFEINQKNNLAILESISNLSQSAGFIVDQLQKRREAQKKQDDEDFAEANKTDEERDAEAFVDQQKKHQVSIDSAQIVAGANIAEAQGANPRAVEQVKVGNPAQQRNRTEAGLTKVFHQQLPALWYRYSRNNGIPDTLDPLQLADEFAKFQGGLEAELGLDRFSAKFKREMRAYANAFERQLINNAVNNEIQVSKDTRLTRARETVFHTVNKPGEANRLLGDAMVELVDLNGGNRAKALDALQAYFEEVDVNGEVIIPTQILENFTYAKDGRITTFGAEHNNPGGRMDKVRENIIRNQNNALKLIRDTDNLRAYEDEQEAIQTFFAGRDNDAGTEKLAEELKAEYELKHSKPSVKLNFILEHLTYKARHRKEAFAQAEKLRDFELNPEVVNGLCRLDPEKCRPFRERLQLYQSKYQGKSFTKDQSTLSSSVSGRSTMLDAKGGERPMIVQLHAEHRDLLELYLASDMEFEAASAKAASDIDKKYQSLYKVNDPTNKYYRKVHRNGTVSYPYLVVAGASRADQARQESEQTIRSLKTLGVEGFLNVPHSVASAERLAFVKENFHKPDFVLLPNEITILANTKLQAHQMFNKALEAVADPARLVSPLKYNGQEVIFTPEENAIINGPGGVNQKLAIINRRNPGHYQQVSTMRPGSPIARAVPAVGRPQEYTPQQRQFANTIYELAKKHGARHPEVAAAIAAFETGWGKTVGGNNPFNMKRPAAQGGGFIDYATVEDSVKDFVRLWDKNHSNFKNLESFDDPNEAFNAIIDAYAPAEDNNPVNSYRQFVANFIASKGYQLQQ